MKAGKTLKSVIATCAIFALPMSAIAGGGHIWAKKQEQVNLDQTMTPNSAVEKYTRNWVQFDFNGDRQISATEIQDYLDGKIALNGFDSAQLPVGLEDTASKALSSTDMGMHYAHGPGKDNADSPDAATQDVMARQRGQNFSGRSTSTSPMNRIIA